MKSRFLFWSYQQILDAFGRPDEMHLGQVVEWWYRRFTGSDFEGWFSVKFCAGFVVNIDSN
ncbi:MAG: hypothetical protein EXS08_10290 [Planctomycetes bacterium]|nr:hypothetical protein [Planctomycetota bacterium]